MKDFLQSRKFINTLILILLAFSVYYVIDPKPVFENRKKLKRELKGDHRFAKAKITNATKINSLIIDDVKYENGWMYTFIFDLKYEKYMGTFFLNTRKFEIEDSVNIMYLPKNPAINEYVE